MARKPTQVTVPMPPQVDPRTGLSLLQRQIEKGQALLSRRPIPEDALSSWELVTRNVLEKAFGVNSPNVSSIEDIGRLFILPDWNDAQWEQHQYDTLSGKLSMIGGLIELLETEVQLQSGQPITAVNPTGSGAAISSAVAGGSKHKIFIVHGHNEAVLHETARFLERIDQDIIILREQPNEGRTIIQKFEDYADVGFAVVLLTGDDRGGSAKAAYEDQSLRARQNVILELGYFLGRLGRNRVCALFQKGVEIPSDYSGVLYIELDQHGGWRFSLAKELKAAGLSVDMNKAV